MLSKIAPKMQRDSVTTRCFLSLADSATGSSGVMKQEVSDLSQRAVNDAYPPSCLNEG
jgi:hypothetical protein